MVRTERLQAAGEAPPRYDVVPPRETWERDPLTPRPHLERVDGDGRWTMTGSHPPPRAEKLHRRYVFAVMTALLFVAVFGQRFVVPIGAFPIALPLVASYVGLALLRLRGGVRYNRVRTEMYLLATGALLMSTWLNTFGRSEWSLNSLLLLLIIYLPWVFCVAPAYGDLVGRLLRTYVRMMTVAAVVAAGQMLAQLSGVWRYEDYLLTWVGKGWLAQDFNTSFPMSYDSPIYKANAFVFLEPSFLSQFLALGVLVALLVRAPAWQPLLMGLGMACTLSGTGIILLLVGVVVLVVRLPSAIKPSYVIAGAIGLIIVFQTPAATFLLDRSDEPTQRGSSGYLRFVQPYTEVARGLESDPSRWLYGAGPGASDRLLESGRRGAGEPVVYTIAPKLAFEYGLIGAFGFIAFILVAILRGPPTHTLPAAAIVMIFFLSGSLLQPHTIVTAWLLTSVWGHPVTFGLTDSLAAWRRHQRDAAAVT